MSFRGSLGMNHFYSNLKKWFSPFIGTTPQTLPKSLPKPLQRSLKNKRVLITGGSKGLGLALAEQYVRSGAQVLICARNSDDLARAKKRLMAFKGDVITFP